jgi:Domain of unknown function (DUF6391)
MIGDYVARVRRNHALEHATVSLLIGRIGPDIRVVGRASGDGFFLYGDIPSDVLGECVQEGLDRLKRGEAFWAVTPHCGTNLATAGVLAALASTAAMGNGDRKGKMGSAIMASMLAMIVAQPVGRMIQRHVTTSPDLADMEVIAIEERSNGRFYKVRTRRRAALAAE